MTTRKIFFSHREELWNAWSHGAGIILGLIFGILFLSRTIVTHSRWAIFAITLYILGMLASYISSTAYHALSAHSRYKETLRKFDHAAIYWHIAGSYSPITLVALRNQGLWGWALFTFVWLCALAGTMLTFRKLKDHSNLETLSFVGMGLSVVVAFRPLFQVLASQTIAWIIAEGVMYITGAAFYSLHHHKYMHTVFHFFVILGTLCHLVAVWQILSEYL